MEKYIELEKKFLGRKRLNQINIMVFKLKSKRKF